MKKIIQLNKTRINNNSLPPIQGRVTNISKISQNYNNISFLEISGKTPLDTYHTSTSNSNVNKILVSLQDRPLQIEQATQLGNTWSDQNRESSSDIFDMFDIEKLRQIQLDGSLAVFDSDCEGEFQVISESYDE
ncbi:Hypothetical_protein [Hexamita inflata]|uniref:Hypothetical_protein n=1 Tax=Hexamita inflata TaxID=28002 RepID=A0AA86QPJ4_9EUKA|nr:Hypothetical protein HINF_LOCUS51064 [Hexamita inflata]